MLLAECAAAGVEIRVNCRVDRGAQGRSGFVLTTNTEPLRVAQSLVVATGGLSIPKLGATDFGYRIAKQFGLTLTEIRPGAGAADLRPGADATSGRAERASRCP